MKAAGGSGCECSPLVDFAGLSALVWHVGGMAFAAPPTSTGQAKPAVRCIARTTRRRRRGMP